jgi:hypothetical protein
MLIIGATLGEHTRSWKYRCRWVLCSAHVFELELTDQLTSSLYCTMRCFYRVCGFDDSALKPSDAQQLCSAARTPQLWPYKSNLILKILDCRLCGFRSRRQRLFNSLQRQMAMKLKTIQIPQQRTRRNPAASPHRLGLITNAIYLCRLSNDSDEPGANLNAGLFEDTGEDWGSVMAKRKLDVVAQRGFKRKSTFFVRSLFYPERRNSHRRSFIGSAFAIGVP